MRKEDKGAIISQLAEVVKQYGHFYLVDTTAMDAAATSELRRKCFKADIKMVVVKNTLLEKALMTIEEVDYSPLFGSLKGTTAVMFSEVANAPAKLLKEYKDGVPSRIDAVVVSAQHNPDVEIEKIREDIKKFVIDAVIPQNLVDDNTKFFINPTGRFVIGGPNGDTGLTGRKIIVDTYGGFARHGGGAFSGKDPTKVDRSAAYAARYVAKNIVAAGAAKRCEVQLAYAIGVARPVSVMVDTFGTGIVSDTVLADVVKKLFDLRPEAIIRTLELRNPIYAKLSAYGHMGREDLNVSWEKTNRVDDIKKALGI